MEFDLLWRNCMRQSKAALWSSFTFSRLAIRTVARSFVSDKRNEYAFGIKECRGKKYTSSWSFCMGTISIYASENDHAKCALQLVILKHT